MPCNQHKQLRNEQESQLSHQIREILCITI